MADTPDPSDKPTADTPAADTAAPDKPPPPVVVKRKKRKKLWIALFILVLVPAVIIALWIWVTLGYTYATGDRAGYVQKISKKGWVCKTWEGELAMANLPGTMPQIFAFTVRNDSVAQLLERNIGKQVSITYEQHRGIPTTCFGETEYFVTGVQRVGP
jgi:hypothetical protein